MLDAYYRLSHPARCCFSATMHDSIDRLFYVRVYVFSTFCFMKFHWSWSTADKSSGRVLKNIARLDDRLDVSCVAALTKTSNWVRRTCDACEKTCASRLQTTKRSFNSEIDLTFERQWSCVCVIKRHITSMCSIRRSGCWLGKGTTTTYRRGS